jgi:hypothetical protein
MQLSDTIDHRDVTQGKYALSIGTSLAFETLFGINDNIPPTNPLPFKSYGYVLINVRTLIRNMYGAVQKELKAEWSGAKYFEKVKEELEMIPLVLSNQSHDKMSAIYYIPSYKSLKKKFPQALWRGTSSKAYAKQHYEVIEQYCIAQLTAAVLRGELSIAMVDVDLPPVDKRAVIMTHLPVDLLSYSKANMVDLIETHTGVIKTKRQWYTKLNGKGLEQIPFDVWSIQVFGDSKQFAGLPPKYRNAIVEFASKNNWNQTTTVTLIKTQVQNRFPDKDIKTEFLKFL